MRIEVVFLSKELEFIAEVDVPDSSSVREAIDQSGLLERYKKFSPDNHQVGIFGKVVTYDTVLKPNDRVEIYQALQMNPMEARRIRAQKKVAD